MSRDTDDICSMLMVVRWNTCSECMLTGIQWLTLYGYTRLSNSLEEHKRNTSKLSNFTDNSLTYDKPWICLSFNSKWIQVITNPLVLIYFCCYTTVVSVWLQSYQVRENVLRRSIRFFKRTTKTACLWNTLSCRQAVLRPSSPMVLFRNLPLPDTVSGTEWRHKLH